MRFPVVWDWYGTMGEKMEVRISTICLVTTLIICQWSLDSNLHASQSLHLKSYSHLAWNGTGSFKRTIGPFLSSIPSFLASVIYLAPSHCLYTLLKSTRSLIIRCHTHLLSSSFCVIVSSHCATSYIHALPASSTSRVRICHARVKFGFTNLMPFNCLICQE